MSPGPTVLRSKVLADKGLVNMPSLISPPLKCLKLNKHPRGLIKLLR